MVKIGRSESRLVFSVRGKRAKERGNHVPLCTFLKWHVIMKVLISEL